MMNHKKQHDNLALLGEELLKEFETAEKIPISTEFDREWWHNLRRENKHPVLRGIRWTATAAVLALALVGALTVATLSIESLRTPLLQLATMHLAEEEIRLEEPEESPDYWQISALNTDNMVLEVYTDGNDNYQLLYANELGQRLYDVHAPQLDEEFFQSLQEELLSAGK